MKRILAVLAVLVMASLTLPTLEAEVSQRKIAYKELSALLADPAADVLLVDVRTAEEYSWGRIPGAVLFPYDEFQRRKAEFATLAGAKDRRIVVYCRTGRRSAIAAGILADLGYTNVSDFGGVGNWQGPTER